MAHPITKNQQDLCSALRSSAELIIRHASELIRLFTDNQQREHKEDAERILEAGRDLDVFVTDMQELLQKGESFAPLRHDIRNTVGLVSGYAEILEDEVAHQPKSLAELRAIQKATGRFLSSLDELSALVSDEEQASSVDELISTLSTTTRSRTEATLGR